jgi:2-methylcitrate dehydratase PrpD
LSEDQSVAAIGISLSQASGVFEFLSNGSSVKSLHPGWAAHSGVYAAKLAAAGMTGPETALEGRWGLFRHFAASDEGAARLESSLSDFGERWHVADAAFKLYPCCHFLHPFIEAAGTLDKKGIVANDIAQIVCRVAPGAAPIICEPWETKQRPLDGHAIRWSLPVTVAARIVEGDVGLATFERNASPAVLDLAQRVSWEPLRETRFPVRFEAEIECKTRGGESHRVVIDDAYGNQSRPAKADELEKKFRTNAARSLSDAGVGSLLSAIATIPQAPDLKALTSALQQVRTSN